MSLRCQKHRLGITMIVVLAFFVMVGILLTLRQIYLAIDILGEEMRLSTYDLTQTARDIAEIKYRDRERAKRSNCDA